MLVIPSFFHVFNNSHVSASDVILLFYAWNPVTMYDNKSQMNFQPHCKGRIWQLTRHGIIHDKFPGYGMKKHAKEVHYTSNRILICSVRRCLGYLKRKDHRIWFWILLVYQQKEVWEKSFSMKKKSILKVWNHLSRKHPSFNYYSHFFL